MKKTILAATLGLLLTGCGGNSSDSEPSAKTTGPQSPVAGEPTPVTPRSYQFSVLGSANGEAPDAQVDVPSGFDAEADWFVVSQNRDEFLGFSMVSLVFSDACHPADHVTVTPGPSVEDLADALVAQTSTRASVPEPVTLDGYKGLYVELAGPRYLSKCTDPGLWDGRGIYVDGQVDRVWILNVDGHRVVVDASHSAESSSAQEVDTLTSMVESLEFVE